MVFMLTDSESEKFQSIGEWNGSEVKEGLCQTKYGCWFFSGNIERECPAMKQASKKDEMEGDDK